MKKYKKKKKREFKPVMKPARTLDELHPGLGANPSNRFFVRHKEVLLPSTRTGGYFDG